VYDAAYLELALRKQLPLATLDQSLAAAAIALRDAQMAALQYQLQPHFLFNSLNAISTLVFEGNRVDAGIMISRLADLLRSTLESVDEPVVSLESELKTARQYLAIEEVRFGPRLQVIVDVEPQALSARVPRFLLQPLLENAIRHGVSRRLDGGRIWLSAQVRKGSLRLSVTSEGEDNPMDSDGKSLSDNGFGFGLANTRQRLLHIYGSKATIETNSGPDQMFEVILSIPVTPNFDPVKE